MPSDPEKEPATLKGTVPPSGLKNRRLGNTHRTQMQLSIPHKTSFTPRVKTEGKEGPSVKILLAELLFIISL